MAEWTKEKIVSLINSGELNSCADLLEKLGVGRYNSGNYRTLNKFATKHGIDLGPLKEKGARSAARDLRHVKRIPDSEVFIKNSTYKGRLAKRLLQLGWKYECGNQKCPVGEMWLGKEIALHVDHINGDASDNRLENLRFLCPNCHQQTETWGSQRRSKKWHPCYTCGTSTKNEKYCSRKCDPLQQAGRSRPQARKAIRPPKNQLIIELESSNWSAVGRKYGVSCNAVRKWVRCYGLDPKSIKIKRPPGGKKLEAPL